MESNSSCSRQTDFHFSQAAPGTRLLVFEKKFVPLAGYAKPGAMTGHETDIAGEPFLGNKDARLQALLPDHPSFDMAVKLRKSACHTRTAMSGTPRLRHPSFSRSSSSQAKSRDFGNTSAGTEFLRIQRHVP